ncbi:MAG: hypothetical protein ABI301_06790 [Jatrophihabitantaceae bacterium]
MTDSREALIAAVNRDLALLEARDAARRLAPRSARRKTGASIVYSIRLDPAEVAELEARAAAIGMKPTVLARNMIRTELAAAQGAVIAAAVDRLEAAMCELHAAVT